MSEHDWQRPDFRPAVRLRDGRTHEDNAASFSRPIPSNSPVVIHASADSPKWVAAARDALQAGNYANGFVLFPGHTPVLITAPVEIREPNGNRSSVTVFNVLPGGARVPDAA